MKSNSATQMKNLPETATDLRGDAVIQIADALRKLQVRQDFPEDSIRECIVCRDNTDVATRRIQWFGTPRGWHAQFIICNSIVAVK